MIAPALQHAVDLMNHSQHDVAATHSVVQAQQLSKSDEMIITHHTDRHQVLCFVHVIIHPVDWM